MITSFQTETLNRDLDQIDKWTISFLIEIPDSMDQDIEVKEAIAAIFNNISQLRTKVENQKQAGISQRNILAATSR